MSDQRTPDERAVFTVPLGNVWDVDSVIDALFRIPFALGDQPFARHGIVRRLPDDADLTPFGGTLLREDARNHVVTRLVRGDGWTMLFARGSDGAGSVHVTAVSEELAAEVVDAILKQDDPPVPVVDRVPMGFWHFGCNGPTRTGRLITSPAWTEIRGNYPRTVAVSLDALMGLEAPSSGRLLLLHGPPGTGKSTVLRTLAREWRAWCRLEYVLDPEDMFKHSSYLLRALLCEDEQAELSDDIDGDSRDWRMLLLEDCDELIRSDAKAEAGQALSRLLNITDGLVGEGLRVLVCITTNESFSRLHPAVARPGRCLVNLEFSAFAEVEASGWLGRTVEHDTTLAELFQLRDGVGLNRAAAPARPGQYL